MFVCVFIWQDLGHYQLALDDKEAALKSHLAMLEAAEKCGSRELQIGALESLLQFSAQHPLVRKSRARHELVCFLLHS